MEYLSQLAGAVKEGAEDLARGVQGKETGAVAVVAVQFTRSALGLTVRDSGGEGVVSAVASGGEAALLGVVPGDRVVRVGAVATSRYFEVIRAIGAAPARPLEIAFERRTQRDEVGGTPGFLNFRLDEEIVKAERILQLMLASPHLGPSRGVLREAKGLAFLRVTKVGFAVSGRFGTGLVVAKLPAGKWSAPSAIGTVGVSMGLQLGAQVADFLVVLNTDAAVTAFSGGGQLTLGAQLGAVAGPVGAAREAAIAGQPAAVAPIFTYSMSQGLFVGVSLEGSAINERTSVNERHYSRPALAVDLLSGKVPPTLAAAKLHAALADLDKTDYDDAATTEEQLEQLTPVVGTAAADAREAPIAASSNPFAS